MIQGKFEFASFTQSAYRQGRVLQFIARIPEAEIIAAQEQGIDLECGSLTIYADTAELANRFELGKTYRFILTPDE
jgi:hypothetical protein